MPVPPSPRVTDPTAHKLPCFRSDFQNRSGTGHQLQRELRTKRLQKYEPRETDAISGRKLIYSGAHFERKKKQKKNVSI